MTPNEYQSEASRTYPNGSQVLEQENRVVKGIHPSLCDIIHASLGVSSEAGELSGAIKKHLIYGQPLDKLNIKEECGDILWYISLMLTSCGYTMESCMQDNIDKLKIRYPEKFTEELAKERLDKKGE